VALIATALNRSAKNSLIAVRGERSWARARSWEDTEQQSANTENGGNEISQDGPRDFTHFATSLVDATIGAKLMAPFLREAPSPTAATILAIPIRNNLRSKVRLTPLPRKNKVKKIVLTAGWECARFHSK
jgi:hypothetical protein